MSFRLPQNLSTQLNPETGMNMLEHEILAERAASLGRAGRLVERSLAKLREASGSERDAALKKAAEAVHGYFVQRELCGLRNHDDPIELYAIPKEVLARLGAR